MATTVTYKSTYPRQVSFLSVKFPVPLNIGSLEFPSKQGTCAQALLLGHFL